MQRAIGRVLVSLVALILFSGLCVAEAPQGDSGDAVPLRLKAGTFDPKAGLPAALRDVAPGPGAAILPAAADRGDLQIVQFNVAPGKAQQDLLAGLGIRVLDFIPERALAVRLVKGVSVDALRALPGVRAVVPLSAALRLSPRVLELGTPRDRGTAPGEIPEAGRRLNVTLTQDADPAALADLIQARLGGVAVTRIAQQPLPRLQLVGSAKELRAAAEALARHPDVMFVDVARPNRLLNDESVWIGQSYDRYFGPHEAEAPDPKPYLMSGTLFQHGLTGTGQVIGVADTRLEHQMWFFTDLAHPLVKQNVPIPGPLVLDPTHRKILAYNNVTGPSADAPPYPTWRHGTHTTGSALGDSLANLSSPTNAGHDTGDGMAPNAKLVYLDMNLGVNTANCTDWICAFCSVNDILKQEYDAGARISTNSWGNDSDAGDEADASVWVHPDQLVLFAAGNDGRFNGAVEGTAGAKNVIGVGASETYNDTFVDQWGIRDPENMAAFSSIGPAWDGRIKPDITAPGVAIASAGFPVTRYPDANDSHCVPNDPNVCFPDPPLGGCYVVSGDKTATTVVLSGTSMASPTAAGLATLAREYFTSGFYPSGQASPADARVPSAALLKAVLINGARNMTGRTLDGNGTAPRSDYGPLADAPSPRQGWGRMVLDDGLYFSGDARKLFIADIASAQGSGLGNGDTTIYKVDVTSTASALKATLVWTDPPAASGAAKDLRNDLDLTVTAPDGTVYRGNQWTADDINQNDDKQSAPNASGRDNLNNVEGFLIRTPQIGQYRFEIKGTSVPGYQGLFTQGYALALSGEFTGAGNYCGAVPPPPQNFTTTVVRWDDVRLDWQAVPGATSYEIWRVTGAVCAPPLDPAVVISAPAGQTSYHDLTTQPSTTYQYTIRALLNPAGCRTSSSVCAPAITPGPPTITLVGPDSGNNNQPTVITITGTGFQATPSVYLGTATQPEKYLLSTVFVSPTQLTATVPVNRQTGSYSIKVKNPDNLSATLAGAFFIGPPLQRMTLYATADMQDYYAADKVAMFDLEQSTTLAPLTLTPFDDPLAVAANSTAGRALVALYGSGPSGERGRVAIVHLGAATVSRTLEVPGAALGRKPTALAIHPSGNKAYVMTQTSSAFSNQQLHVLDLQTGAFTGSALTIGAWGNGLAAIKIAPDGQRLYATNSADDTISVINTSNFTEITRVAVGDVPVGLAISPNSSKIYVVNIDGESVSIVDAVSLTTVGTIDLSNHPNPDYQSLPCSAVVSPDGTKLYVAFNSNLVWNIATVDLTTLQVTQAVNNLSWQYSAITYVPPLAKLFALAVFPDVDRYSPTTLQVEWSQSTGGYSYGMDWVSPIPLDIVSVAPALGCKNGGITVTITGTGFQGEVLDDAGIVVQARTRVLFGGVEATSVVLVNSTRMDVTLPAHPTGRVNVEVRNPNGKNDILPQSFTYKNCITPVE